MTLISLNPLKSTVTMRKDLLQLSVVTVHMVFFSTLLAWSFFSILGTITETILAEKTYTPIMTGFMTY